MTVGDMVHLKQIDKTSYVLYFLGNLHVIEVIGVVLYTQSMILNPPPPLRELMQSF